MTDLASLVIAVDSTAVKSGTEALGGLTAAGKAAETQSGALVVSQTRAVTAFAEADKAVRRNQFAIRNLGQQFGDFGQQALSGAGVARAFAQQVGQMGYALSEFESGPLKSVGNFLGGPWGVALTLAIQAVAAFSIALDENEDASKKAGKSHELVTTTAEGLAQALVDLTAAQDKASKSARDGKVDAQSYAAYLYIQAEAARSAAKAALQLAIAEQEIQTTRASAPGQRGENATLTLDTATKRASSLREQLAVLTKTTEGMRDTYRRAKADLVEYDTTTEAAAKAQDAYTASVNRAKAAFVAKRMSQAELTAEVAKAKATLTAAEDADKNARKATSEHNKELREQAKLQREAAQAAKGRADELLSLRQQQNKWAAGFDFGQGGDLKLGKTPSMDITTDWERATKALDAYEDSLRLIEDAVADVGDALANAFGRGGAALGDAMDAAMKYGDQIKVIAAREAAQIGTTAENRKAAQQAALQGTTALLGATKGLFSEHSKGYKAMEAAEKALAVVQLAQTAAAVAKGAATMFGQLGVFAFPAVAAMAAVMAGFGFKGGGSVSGSYKAEDIQKAQGTGSILGDSSAKSSSLANALEMVAKNTDEQLQYSNDMLRSLRSIDRSIGALAGQLARQLGISAGDTEGFGLGSKTSLSGINGALTGIGSSLPIVGGIIGGIQKALFGTKTTRTLVDQGVKFYASTLADILAGGIEGANYSLIEIKKKKKFLGISAGGSTKTEEYTNELDSAVEQQATLLIANIYESVVAATKAIGMEGVDKLLQSFQIDLGKISLDGLKGSEITDAISAVFSKAADDMASAALPGLMAFQKVGEGTFETLIRLATDYQTVDVQLASVGRSFGAIGVASVAARESLIDMFGSLDEFVSKTSFYREKFLTEAEQIAPVMAAVDSELSRLGLSGVDTIDAFKAIVSGLDLTSEAGQQLYASLMALAPGFKAVEDYQAKQAQQAVETAREMANVERSRQGLMAQILSLSGDKAGALAIMREQELAAMDASLRPLQKTVYALEDMAEAAATAAAAAEKFAGYRDNLRALRDSLSMQNGTSQTSYQAAQAKFIQMSARSAVGDEGGLTGLPDAINAFLEQSRNRSTSTQFQRDVATAIAAADKAASAADKRVTVEEGIVALNSNSIQISENVSGARRVLEEISRGQSNFTAELATLRAEMKANLEPIVFSTGQLSRDIHGSIIAGILTVRANADEPLPVTVSGTVPVSINQTVSVDQV